MADLPADYTPETHWPDGTLRQSARERRIWDGTAPSHAPSALRAKGSWSLDDIPLGASAGEEVPDGVPFGDTSRYRKGIVVKKGVDEYGEPWVELWDAGKEKGRMGVTKHRLAIHNLGWVDQPGRHAWKLARMLCIRIGQDVNHGQLSATETDLLFAALTLDTLSAVEVS